jgi:hypothetical protein
MAHPNLTARREMVATLQRYHVTFDPAVIEAIAHEFNCSTGTVCNDLRVVASQTESQNRIAAERRQQLAQARRMGRSDGDGKRSILRNQLISTGRDGSYCELNMNYKDTVAQATIALYSAAFIRCGGRIFRDPEILSSTIKEAEKLADELRITARLDSIDKNDDPVQFTKGAS